MVYQTDGNNILQTLILASCLLLLSVYNVNSQHLLAYPNLKNDSLFLEVENRFPCTINLNVTSTQLDTSFKKTIAKNKKRLVFQMANPPGNLIREIKDVFQFDYIFGDPNAVHDDDYEYNLPYPKGKAYRLTQGNKSTFTHNTPQAKYAFDFAVPEGDFISAARGGVVTHVVEKYKEGGQERSMMEQGNQIIICQNDGTIAHYAHLQYQGAFVEVGESVFVGEVIGRSGNTGYSTAPHLHFSVLISGRSIPIRFRNQYTILYEGELYRHE
ncbi:M23 family metallopeptidase [Fodinibius halophilus]|uniref:M23 family metallopeptidase n=1 Tax=Fodinibius halophilus TaxID=1736908 RepID=A0A6M1T6P1_9BACT|nr:M23 family metallopeptidase [Fodinibius halophilus]NGP88965.1 M23 family metallopeptidase [Fodinibius halophilus]